MQPSRYEMVKPETSRQPPPPLATPRSIKWLSAGSTSTWQQQVDLTEAACPSLIGSLAVEQIFRPRVQEAREQRTTPASVGINWGPSPESTSPRAYTLADCHASSTEQQVSSCFFCNVNAKYIFLGFASYALSVLYRTSSSMLFVFVTSYSLRPALLKCRPVRQVSIVHSAWCTILQSCPRNVLGRVKCLVIHAWASIKFRAYF